MTTIPIATPDQAAKFIRELYRPYLCTECGKVFAKVSEKGIQFCGHRQNTEKRSDPNTQSRPWAKDVALIPDLTYESRQKPWIPIEPPAWRRVAINRNGDSYTLAHFGSRTEISDSLLRRMGFEFSGACKDLAEALKHGALVETALQEKK